jgi:hypothetical protein
MGIELQLASTRDEAALWARAQDEARQERERLERQAAETFRAAPITPTARELLHDDPAR